MLYLEIHNKRDGQATFKCSTRYDFYVLKNITSHRYTTRVVDEKGMIHNVVLVDWDFFPSYCIDKIQQLLGKSEVIYSSSLYESRKNI